MGRAKSLPKKWSSAPFPLGASGLGLWGYDSAFRVENLELWL